MRSNGSLPRQLFNGRILAISLSLLVVLAWTPMLCAKGLGGRSGGGNARGGNPRGGMGAARPNMGAGARPNIGTPNMSAGTGRLPMQRPQTSMPHLGGNSGISRPNAKLPDRGDLGNLGTNRPTTLPGRTPGNARPGLDGRPNVNRPAMPDFGRLPNGRPSGGELGDFLGIDGSIRPTGPNRPTTLPAEIGNRPNIDRPNFDRPNIDWPNINRPETDRPITRPVDRPRPGDRQPIADRPIISVRPRPEDKLPIDKRPNIRIGDVNLGNNTIISNKPSWARIDNNQVNAINQRWQNVFGNASTLPALAPGRLNHFHNWGDQVRGNWHGNRGPGYFRPNWWANHPFRCSGWHYFYAYSYYPHTYWWSTPSYNDVTGWFRWNAPTVSWQQPVYYDYGNEGNVTYQDNSVYIGAQMIADSDQFAQSAATLATVPPPESEEQAESAEWLPLGTFALTTDPDDVDPTRIVQLAVNREGIVTGTLYNSKTDQSQAIQGRVDKETQRVAMRIGTSEDVIAETGLYNLTQDEASLLVHFGNQTQDSCLLVRLPTPEQADDSF